MKRGLTPLAMTVLYLLSRKPMHPYEMRQRMRVEGIDRLVRITHGALYHAVERLADCGMIEPVETSREGRRPERTVYARTEAGREAALERMREMLSVVCRDFPTFRAALAFVQLLPPEEAVLQLRYRAVLLEAELAALQTAYDGLIKHGVPRVGLLESEHMQAVTRAELDLTRSIVADIDAGRLTWSVPTGRDHL